VRRNADRATPLALGRVSLAGGFLGSRVETNRAVTLPAQYEHCKRTGRIDAWKLNWREGRPNKPHIFWDSDVAKWIEAAAYSLATHPDTKLAKLVDDTVDLIAAAQQPDGCLNTYFTTVEPDGRWSNLRDCHELYCAGHLIEAAVALFESTGSRRLLGVMRRYADLIGDVFGRGEGQKRGYPGHQEIELALVRLYRATGEARYLDLARYFLDERGRRPHYFDLEAKQRGEIAMWPTNNAYRQAHLPVRGQTEAVGHAVRACYMYTGMADVAAEMGDKALRRACEQLWENVTERRMYVTGGVGSTHHGERFTSDYDLPNETAYAETCAAIALFFWAHRMLHLGSPDGRYADVMERALYNGILSGVSLDGASFFYANPLAAYPGVNPHGDAVGETDHYRRSKWFGCACCPPNVARLLSGLGAYVYSAGKRTIYAHLYTPSSADVELAAGSVRLEQETSYPWEGSVRLVLHPDRPTRFALALHLPGWCRRPAIEVNEEALDPAAITEQGYARIEREWRPGDRVHMVLATPIERIASHPRVKQNVGCVALQRGPVVYCLEEADNGPELSNVLLPREAALSARFDADLLGGVVAIAGEALREASRDQVPLYRPADPGRAETEPFAFKAIPYCLWANREPGEMRVWIREGN
jgi:DUF1680 family protein